MTATNLDYDPNPNPSTTADQNVFNTQVKANLAKVNLYALSRQTAKYFNASIAPPATTYQIVAYHGDQYLGLTSGASPGALIHVKFPIDTDMTPMDSFFIQDISTNSNTYTITLETQGSVKIYGPGLSTSGVTSVQITDNGGYKEFIYVTTDKIFMISKSA